VVVLSDQVPLGGPPRLPLGAPSDQPRLGELWDQLPLGVPSDQVPLGGPPRLPLGVFPDQVPLGVPSDQVPLGGSPRLPLGVLSDQVPLGVPDQLSPGLVSDQPPGTSSEDACRPEVGALADGSSRERADCSSRQPSQPCPATGGSLPFRDQSAIGRLDDYSLLSTSRLPVHQPVDEREPTMEGRRAKFFLSTGWGYGNPRSAGYTAFRNLVFHRLVHTLPTAWGPSSTALSPGLSTG
jgi:hypothetical protein